MRTIFGESAAAAEQKRKIAKRDRAAEKQASRSVIQVVPGYPERRRRDGASSLHLIMGRLVDPSKVPHLIVRPGDEPRLFSILLGRRAGLRGRGAEGPRSDPKRTRVSLLDRQRAESADGLS